MATENSYYKKLLKAKSRNTRNSFAMLKHPFRKTNTGRKPYPSLWNNLPETIKKKKKIKHFQT